MSVNAYNLPKTDSGLNDNMLAIRMFSSCSLVGADEAGNFIPWSSTLPPARNSPANATSYYVLAGPTAWIYNEEGQLNGEAIPMIARRKWGRQIGGCGRHTFSDYEIGNDVSNTALTPGDRLLAGYQRTRSRDVRNNCNSGDIVTPAGVNFSPTSLMSCISRTISSPYTASVER